MGCFIRYRLDLSPHELFGEVLTSGILGASEKKRCTYTVERVKRQLPFRGFNMLSCLEYGHFHCFNILALQYLWPRTSVFREFVCMPAFRCTKTPVWLVRHEIASKELY